MSPTPSSLEKSTVEIWLPRVRIGTVGIHEWPRSEDEHKLTKDLKLQGLFYVRGLRCRRRRACGCYFRAGRMFARVAICSCSRRPCCRRMCVRAEANEGGGGVRKIERKGKEFDTGVRTDGVLGGVGG